MSISVHAHLLSGKRASVEVEADASVESLKLRAQSALVVPSRGRLLNSSGEVLDSALTNYHRSEVGEWRRAHSPCEPGPAQTHHAAQPLCVRRSLG